MNLHKFLETFLPTTKDESDAEDPTLPSARHPPKTPLPRREPRKLSGTMVLRFDEALKKLGEPAEALNRVREKARAICTDEEKDNFDDITGITKVPAPEKKE